MKVESIVLGSIGTNCYIVINEETKECFAVDMAECPQEYVNYIKNNGLEMKALFLTHGHFDHIMGIDDFLKAFPVPVYAGEDELPVIEDDRLIAEYTTGNKLTHSQTLLPMLNEVIKRTSFEMEDIDAIAVAKGPGSFTGLRIGAATAKGLGLALNKPIVPVPTVDGLAYQLFGTSKIICPMMDARRKQVYTGFYRFEGGEMKVLKEQCAQSVEDTLDQLRKYNEPVIFLGDGVPVYHDEIMEKMGESAIFAPAHANRQRAAAVGALAQVYFAQGIYESADEFVPDYLRKSQAEREREERLHGQK